jgi:hypothetical protein
MPYFSIRATITRPWGPPPMMYPPYLPWTGCYGPWTSLPMHFHPRWSGPVEGFGHGGCYIREDRYGSVGHQQDRKASRQKNWTVRNTKSGHPIPPKTTEAPGQPHKQSVRGSEDAQRSGGNQDQIGLRSKTSTNDKAKHNTEKGPEKVAAKQNKAQGEETEIRAKAVASS